ncbi:MAG: exodeoxyribonuclease V subunit gamma [Desulfobacteraceae bacterium IS3]|nr:MAG: exodeoxyribonuclease V subunit gamma [Desulfobacteraceae bacterium IS3]
MKNFRLFTGNRLEILAERLAELLQMPLPSPLLQEIIVVQSQGMKRWVSMELARRLGVCANIRFPFPNDFIYDMFQKVIPEVPETSPYNPKIMTWKIMKCLPECLKNSEFELLGKYLKGNEENLKRFQLSERIANLYDQYLTFRPEMILNWEKGKENDNWQAILWCKLVKESETRHRAALAASFHEKNFSLPTSHFSLPSRVSVFGISALPSFHIQMFADISAFSEVNLFLMNPCEAYWSDILSNREIKRASAKAGAEQIDTEYLHLEQGNSLLASMGMLGRDFFKIIQEIEVLEEESFFDDPGEDSLLFCLQSDIMNLRERGNDSCPKTEISEQDASLQIHSCHSPMREVEVLHDRLLKMFEEDSSLTPRDILVMTPDIEAYSPYIQAVFDLPKDDSRRIPFSIADRSLRVENRLIDTFLLILDLRVSRFGAGQVMSILETPAVRQKFTLSDADLERIRTWIKETGIRWGIDSQNRKNLGLPELSENTWKAGLDRLLLGYAMPEHEEKLFEDILPYSGIEGNEALILGRFLDFTDRLFSHVQTSLAQAHTLTEWSFTLKKLLDDLFEPDENSEDAAQRIRDKLNEFEEIQHVSGFDEKTEISVIAAYLKYHFKKEPSPFGFITGGVTFCAMLPMRSIPFKVIALLGMNSDVYPRQSRPLGFDLMAKFPKLGDPSRRNDDRYLFLESLLSARKTFYISYVGQSIRDNSTIPPSVLVSELSDCIEKGFEIPKKHIIDDHIVTKHRLQAFSPEYFKEGQGVRGERQKPRLFSYSKENLEAARCLLKSRTTPAAFISASLSEPEDEWKTVQLGELCQFFSHPARFLLKKRLGIHLDEDNAFLEEKELFNLEGLDKYFFNESLAEKGLEDRNIREFFALKKAAGQLPHGTVGACVYQKHCQEIERFIKKLKPHIRHEILNPLEANLCLNGFKLTGRIESIYPEKLVHFRCAKVKPKDRLKTWIHHLALNALRADGYPRCSLFAGSDAMTEYMPHENAGDMLEKLLNFYWDGLRKPLHFFPKSSYEYALKLEKSPEDALKSAREKWEGNDWSSGESEDSYFQLCFGKSNPLDAEFQSIATEVFEPLLTGQKK